ncbi:hypothetical protein CXF85_00585 [Colwellia sp. 75C3]|uniref:hypothetical protein n=1 Tax=Colwellia sp. 75C3 TaxID=888425 RepID=UPI000C340E67|nr:hypothetical protein [Colwellia sp. 75C3]PKG86242.1 hypothetical protein CXF85_00585 [Colwellia sp. 75C3]
MKIICVVLMCFFILACSSTKVHLYTRYLSAEETQGVTQDLEALGFDVIANTLVFPDDIEQSTLLYSPFVEGENSINALIDSLDKSGWVVSSVKPLFSGNHYYAQNSVGLLLLPDGVVKNDRVTTQDLANEYVSKKCQSSIKLRLNSDATYQFLYSNNTYNENEQLKGKWQITSYPYIELISLNKAWRFYYEVQKSIESDVVGKIEVIELKPVDEQYTLPECSYVYGIRA